MSVLTARDIEHIFEALRKGLVPERGSTRSPWASTSSGANCTGNSNWHRAARGPSSSSAEATAVARPSSLGWRSLMPRPIISLRVSWSSPTTICGSIASMTSTARSWSNSVPPPAPAARWATSWTSLDRPCGGEPSIAAGQDENAPDFDEVVRRRLEEDLAAMTGGQAPQDFVRVIQTIFDLKQQGEAADAGALISWLCGSGNVAAAAKKAAGIKGDIGSRDALDYLRGVLEIVKAAGYGGLVIIIDEAETIVPRARTRGTSRSTASARLPTPRAPILGCSGSSPARRSSMILVTASLVWPRSMIGYASSNRGGLLACGRPSLS